MTLLQYDKKTVYELKNQELQLVLDSIQGLSQSKQMQNIAVYFNEICTNVLPCAYGGIGIFNKRTNKLKWLLQIGENSGQKSGMNTAVLTGMNIHKKLFAVWVGMQQLIFIRNPAEKGVFQCVSFQGQSMTNLILDGVVKAQSDEVCFYCLFNIDELNLPKYQIFMRLLLLNVYGKLMRLLQNSESGEADFKSDAVTALTEREKQIICRIRGGLNNKKIARQLNISVNTVKCHIYNIFQKLQVSNRVEALLIAEEAGYIN